MAHDAIYENDREEVVAANRAEIASSGVTRTSRTTGTSRFVSGTQGCERDSTNVDSPSTRASPFLQFVLRTEDGAQPSIRSMIKKKEKKDADRLMGRMIFWSDLPLSITNTNPFF